jgi:hypothetical protein
MHRPLKILILIISLSIIGCSTTDTGTIKKKEGENNFFINIYDTDIDNPDNDRRCYYMIYIDKIEAGRTTTGLESQEKYFDTLLSSNRHLIKVEKWILNERLGRYIKMNNIDQPKPDFIYINIDEDKIVKVKLKSSKSGIASYSMTVE